MSQGENRKLPNRAKPLAVARLDRTRTSRRPLCALSALLLGAAGAVHAGEPQPLRTCRALTDVIRAGQVGVPFDVTAQVNGLSPMANALSLQDDSGAVCIDSMIPSLALPRRWERVRLTGRTVSEDGDVKGRAEHLTVLSAEPPPVPEPTTIRELLRTRPNGKLVSLTATVVDAFADEIDPRIRFLILNDGNDHLFAVYDPKEPTLRELLGTTLRIRGVSHPENYSTRKHFGLQISVFARDDVEIVRRQPDFPFSAPLLGDCTGMRPQDISALGRRRLRGHVLAAWNRDRFLLRASDGRLALVRLSGGKLPRNGRAVEVVGFPETDLYQVNLTRAVWRPAELPPTAETAAVTNLALRTLTRQDEATPYFNPKFRFRAIRLSGRIDGVRKDDEGRGTFVLHDGRERLTVDATALPQALAALQDGDLVEATGVCVLEADEWRPNLVFPHVSGLRLVPRSPADLRRLAHAPWWTPVRVLSILATLFALLAAVGAWNVGLKRLVRKREQQLAREAIARAESEFKVCERTRLAVELHDALSQALTGVSMEIRAADKGLATSATSCRGHLVRAERTIDACRGELKNVLWDLRNDAMDEADMNEAIRRTLAPHLGAAALTVRFAVPRERFSDNTAHALLCIVRELTVNAIRHGHATHIRIAGVLENGRFLCSVRDDGCGFDPETAPGIAEGHFGLQGIRERIDRFGGDLEIASSPQGGGTKVTVTLIPPPPPPPRPKESPT